MKTIFFVFSVLFLFNIAACDDSQNYGSQCTFEEYKENVANTECLAEELLVGCSNVACSGIDSNFRKFGFENCTFVDCQTLSCEGLRAGIGEPSQPGFLAEITVDEMTGFPIGIYEIGEMQGDFICDTMFVGN